MSQVEKKDMFSRSTYRQFKRDYERQEYLHSIWAFPKNDEPYEIIRSSSSCSVRCKIPNRFKKGECDE